MPRRIHREKLEEQLHDTIEEARMVLPGVQATLGFQLVAVFNRRFEEALSQPERAVHCAAFLLVATATCLLMTPAAYHRIAQRHTVDAAFLRLASHLLACAMLPLAAGLSLDAYLLCRLTLQTTIGAVVIAAALFAAFLAMWYALPLRARRRKHVIDRGI